MSVEVCPPNVSQLPQLGFSNESILSVMTVAYMQNGALPNGTAVISEAPEQEWVVQKFGGESIFVRALEYIAERHQVRAWENFRRT